MGGAGHRRADAGRGVLDYGQFFFAKASTLLGFAGIWALMHGITDIVSAFPLRSLRNVL